MSIELLLAAAQHLEQQSKRKRDEDGRDDASLDTPARHPPPPPPPPPAAPPAAAPYAGRAARTPSAFIAAHHSYVRSAAGPGPAPAPHEPPEPRNGAVLVPPAPPPPQPPQAPPQQPPQPPPQQPPQQPPQPPQQQYRYEGAEEIQERKARVSAGTREVHNKLEKNRRAHLKECFENLRRQVPMLDDKRTSNLGILRGALRYIATLKRKERECEHEMERLAREKIANQQRLAQLKRDLSAKWDHIDFSTLLPPVDGAVHNDDSNSTLSASERLEDSYQGSPERELSPPAPEPGRRSGGERPAAASPAYLGHSSGYSSGSPTAVPGPAAELRAGPAAAAAAPGGGLARLAAMASSQSKLLVTAGHKVSVVQAGQDAAPPPADRTPLIHAEHGVQYVPVTALSEVGRSPATVSYLEQPIDASRKALVLETVPGHIVNAQLMPASGGVRLSGAGVQLTQSSLQVLTPTGVRLVTAAGQVHATTGTAAMPTTMGAGQRTVLALPSRRPADQAEAAPTASKVAVSGVTQLVSGPLPRLVTQPVTHLVASATPGTMTVLGQPKVVKQIPMITPYITSASQSPKSMVVVSAASLLPCSKH